MKHINGIVTRIQPVPKRAKTAIHTELRFLLESQRQVATALFNCLVYLEMEAMQVGLAEVADLIGSAAHAASDVVADRRKGTE